METKTDKYGGNTNVGSEIEADEDKKRLVK